MENFVNIIDNIRSMLEEETIRICEYCEDEITIDTCFTDIENNIISIEIRKTKKGELLVYTKVLIITEDIYNKSCEIIDRLFPLEGKENLYLRDSDKPLYSEIVFDIEERSKEDLTDDLIYYINSLIKLRFMIETLYFL